MTPDSRRKLLTALTFLRRDRRRARIVISMMSRTARPGNPASAPPAVASETRPDPEVASRERVPWLLAGLAVIFCAALVFEVALARRRYSAAQAEKAAKTAAAEAAIASKSPWPAVESPKASAALPEKTAPPLRRERVDPAGPRAETLPRTRAVAPDPDSKGAIAGIDAGLTSPAARIGPEWRGATAAAYAASSAEVEAPSTARGPTTEDPFETAIRRISVLERLMAIDEVAALIESGDERGAAALLSRRPDARPAAKASAASIPAGDEPAPDDGELAKGLGEDPGVHPEARLELLKTYRTRVEPPGPLDARSIVQEALGGISRASRAVARGMLMDRWSGSRWVLEAVNDRFSEFAGGAETARILATLSGSDPAGPAGVMGVRAAIAGKILALTDREPERLDAAVESLAATLRRAAERRGYAGASSDPALLLILVDGEGPPGPPPFYTGALRPSMHRLVWNGNLLLRRRVETLAAAGPDRAAAAVSIGMAAAGERRRAPSALSQAIADARAFVALDAVRMGVKRVDKAAAEPGSGARSDGDLPSSDAIVRRFGDRLAALAPSRPEDYLLLAEEIADESRGEDGRALARRLFGLAGAWGAERYGSSAALALASLEDATTRDGAIDALAWRILAARWDGGSVAFDPPVQTAASRAPSTVRAAVVDALVQYRRGVGYLAAQNLRRPEVSSLFDAVIALAPGGKEAFLAASKSPASKAAVASDARSRRTLLRIVRALLDPGSERWSDSLALGGDRPVVDIPLGSPAEAFRVDPERCLWRDGRWVR